MLKHLLLLAVAVAVAADRKHGNCDGLLASKPNIVVFGDSLSDAGANVCNPCGQYKKGATAGADLYCQRPNDSKNKCYPAKAQCSKNLPPCRAKNLGFVGAIQEQFPANFDKYLAGHAAIGYHSYRWTNRHVWPEYLGQLIRKDGCRRVPQPTVYAVSGSQASAPGQGVLLKSDGQAFNETIAIGPISSQVDAYLASSTAASTDIIIIWTGANDMRSAGNKATEAGQQEGLFYTAAATYFATTPSETANAEGAVGAVMAAGADLAHANEVVGKLLPVLMSGVDHAAIGAFITAEATKVGNAAAAAKMGQAVQAVMTAVGGLQARGYSSIFVMAPPPLYLSPMAVKGNFVAAARAMGAQFGGALKQYLGNTVAKYWDFSPTFEAIAIDIATNAPQDPTDTTCLWLNGAPRPLPATSTKKTKKLGKGFEPGVDCTGFAFVDDLHPTDLVHKAIADEVLAALKQTPVPLHTGPYSTTDWSEPERLTESEELEFAEDLPNPETGDTVSGAVVAQASALLVAALAVVALVSPSA